MSLYSSLTQVLAPFAAKINGLLTGWDGTKYSTPGEAVRQQIADLHVMIGDEPGKAISASAVAYEDSNVGAELSGLKERLGELEDGGLDIKDDVIEGKINEWLYDHPEATTTVQDGSLTVKKFTIGALGYVSYEMFGAKLDGESDDSEAVRTAHEYANEKGIPVVQKGGRLLVNFSGVPVKTDCDLALDFVITDDTPNNAYIIEHDATEEITASIAISAGANTVTKDILKGHFCVPYKATDELSLGIRNSGGTADVQFWHHQPLAVDLNGNILTMYPWVTLSGNGFQLRGYSRIDESGLTIRGGNIVVDKTNAYGFPTLFKISRNNTKIENFTVNCPDVIDSNESAGGLFAVYKCCNILLSNINGLNHSVSATLAHAYVIDIYGAWNVRIANCNIMQGWGAMASHFSDTICMENCTINRWDGHYGVFGTNIIHNCNFVGLGMIRIGYGAGAVDIDGCTCSQNSADTNLTNGFISFRNDFPVYYQGSVFVRHLKSLSHRLINLSDYNLAVTGTVGTFPDDALKITCYNLDVGAAMNVFNTAAASRKIDFYAYDCSKIRFSHTTTGITIRLYNSNISRANVNDNNVYIYGGSAGEVETTGVVWVSGARIVGNIKAESVEFYSCHSRTALTVTANNIRVENCGGLARVALVGEAIVHNSYKWGTVSVSGAIKQVSKTLAFNANGVADLDFVITTSTVLVVYSRTKIDSNPIFFIPFTNDTKWNAKAETASGPVANQSVAVSIYYIDKT